MHQLVGMEIFEAPSHATVVRGLGLARADEKGRNQARAIVGGSMDRRRRCNGAPLREGQQNRSLEYLGERHFRWNMQTSSTIHHDIQNVVFNSALRTQKVQVRFYDIYERSTFSPGFPYDRSTTAYHQCISVRETNYGEDPCYSRIFR